MVMIVLGIETSCDDTSIAVLNGKEILSNVVSSQVKVHQIYGGVVPELASRHHLDNFNWVLQKAIDAAQANVSGRVRLKLFKGNASVVGRRSESSLYDQEVATFEADQVYQQSDAEGFIRLNALRLRLRQLSRAK